MRFAHPERLTDHPTMVTHVSIITLVLVCQAHGRVHGSMAVCACAYVASHACHQHMPHALVAAIRRGRRVINFGFASFWLGRVGFFLRSSAYYHRTHGKSQIEPPSSPPDARVLSTRRVDAALKCISRTTAHPPRAFARISCVWAVGVSDIRAVL